MVLGPRSPILCHTCATNCATICGTCGTKFFCATFCGTYFLYFTCDPFYSSHFWIPDPLFCGTNSATICGTCGTKFFVPPKVPQIEGHEAHNLPVPCSSIPFLYYRLLTRPLPSLPYSSSTSYLIHPILPTLPYSTSTHFPKDHTPQVRPDLVPAVHFCFFLYLFQYIYLLQDFTL